MIDSTFSLYAGKTLPLCLLIAFFLDLLLGDPENWPHPVRLMGKLIHAAEGWLRPSQSNSKKEIQGGLILALGLPSLCTLILTALSVFLFRIQPVLYLIFRVVMIWKLLALKNLADEGSAVAKALRENGLAAGRQRLSRIVGRETKELTDEEVIKATVETIAENFSDGIVAPLFYLLLFDLPGMFFYKFVNTQDSMLGYRDSRYLYFGRAAARLDDIFNLIPSRISAAFLFLAAALLRENPRRALRIWKRDRRKHLSPNAGQGEAMMAGALGIRLGGSHSYHGEMIEKPFIGDQIGTTDISDIDRSIQILYLASALAFLFVLSLAWLR